MRLPDHPPVAGLAELLGHVGELAVEAIHVDPDDLDALVDQPERGLAGHPGLIEVLGRPEEPVAPVHDHHDVEWLEPVADLVERLLEVGDGDLLARLLVAQVEHHAV